MVYKHEVSGKFREAFRVAGAIVKENFPEMNAAEDMQSYYIVTTLIALKLVEK